MTNKKIDDKKILKRIEKTLEELQNKDFNLFFFVVDSRNTPNGSMNYIYNMAKTLFDKGYKVTMLYQLGNEYTQEERLKLEQKNELLDEKRLFIGVNEWLGEEYNQLPHLNIATEEWSISPSDFLFIPEVFSSLMYETFKQHATCKRYVILQNFEYITEFIPLGVQWANYGINDVICNTTYNEERVKEIFPYVKTKLIKPFIHNRFREPLTKKKLIVNVIAKNQHDVNFIVKAFYWKYPIYKFVSFRDIRNFPQEQYAELLQESAITIWVDEDTNFGYSPLEAMRCGNIVIGKIPKHTPEWMGNDETLFDNGIWFNDLNKVHTILAKVIGSWLQDEIPEVLIENMKETNKSYTFEEWENNVTSTFEQIIKERYDELNNFYLITKSKINE